VGRERHQGAAIATFSVRSALNLIEAYVRRTTEAAERERGARRLSFAIARTAAAARLVTHADVACTALDSTGHADEAQGALVMRTLAPMNRWLSRQLAVGLDVEA
jgi:hypothetical protein